jgi:hypothetical protein
LLAFAEAVAGTDDAAPVASNFARMVRVADATGTPLDAPVVMLNETLRRDLGVDRFPAAADTRPPHPLWRLAGRLVRPIAFGVLRLRGRLRGRR